MFFSSERKQNSFDYNEDKKRVTNENGMHNIIQE